MKLYVALSLTVLLSGCASGPKPYDGVIGYQVMSKNDVTQVIYIDEARVEREKTLGKISAVCSMHVKTEPESLTVKVISEDEYVTDVSISVPVSTGSTATGDLRGTGASGSVSIRQAVNQNQALTRQMRVRKVAAICPHAAP